MMTEATHLTQNHEVKRNYINHLLKQLTVDYQNTKQERKEIASLSPASEEEFTLCLCFLYSTLAVLLNVSTN